MAKKAKSKLLSIDFQFGIPQVIPAKQESYKNNSVDEKILAKESQSILAFKKSVSDTIDERIGGSGQFPTKKEVFLCIIQFFNSKKEYETRDIDNLSKTVLDTLKNKFYDNDSQVRTILSTKKLDSRIDDNFAYIAIKELVNENDVNFVKESGIERAIVLYQELKAHNLL